MTTNVDWRRCSEARTALLMAAMRARTALLMAAMLLGAGCHPSEGPSIASQTGATGATSASLSATPGDSGRAGTSVMGTIDAQPVSYSSAALWRVREKVIVLVLEGKSGAKCADLAPSSGANAFGKTRSQITLENQLQPDGKSRWLASTEGAAGTAAVTLSGSDASQPTTGDVKLDSYVKEGPKYKLDGRFSALGCGDVAGAKPQAKGASLAGLSVEIAGQKIDFVAATWEPKNKFLTLSTLPLECDGAPAEGATTISLAVGKPSEVITFGGDGLPNLPNGEKPEGKLDVVLDAKAAPSVKLDWDFKLGGYGFKASGTLAPKTCGH
jgi:hypothetical protein